MLARVETVALTGITARRVEVEVDLGPGLPGLNLVGLPDGAVREARDRVRSALHNSGFRLPARRIIINLAPADLPKEGGAYDLPMAVGLLTAAGRLPQAALERRLFLGELSLDGRLKPVPGCLPAALFLREQGLEELVVPPENAPEGALVPGLRVIAPPTLLALVRHLLGEERLDPAPPTRWERWLGAREESGPDMAAVKGQEYARRALEVAAAGGHNLVMSGPPGSGKTLLARCMPGILPPLTLDEALEVTAVYSVAGHLSRSRPLIGCRPFRSPHHTASQVALVGGGGRPLPGEVSLSHHGVLFLDELTEFTRPTLEVLRQPLEAREVTISRAQRSARFPAAFQLLAAFNPCPCGHLGDPHHDCHCSRVQVERYRSRLSGPLLDRIDLHVAVTAVPFEELTALEPGEASAAVAARVSRAREVQQRRNGPRLLNCALDGPTLERLVPLGDQSLALLRGASQRLGFSARAFHRILRVARTIADLEESERVHPPHLAEAIQYRLEGGIESGPSLHLLPMKAASRLPR
ncbi:MAG: YifB family Mg chelatase-like AAA ATPase [Magnetococcales bacterium]|nr:YifB family Mg chelatase-like AAA ATPase [Magnetococcales bacterium]